MTMSSKVACVVLNYKDADECARYARWAENLDVYDYIILVDNKSPDDSYEKLKKLQNNRIKVYQSEKNGGYGYGNNFGVKIAGNEFGCDIAFISNPDVSYTKESVGNLVHFMEEKPKCSVISGIQYNGFTGKRRDDSAWNSFTYTEYVLMDLFLLKRLLSKRRSIINADVDYQKVDCVLGAFMAVRIHDFLAWGGYDEGMFLYGEESALGYRMKAKGYYTYLAPHEKYYHFESSSISKSYPSMLSRFKLVMKSRKYMLNHYFNLNWFQRGLAGLLINTAIFETVIKQYIKINILKMNG